MMDILKNDGTRYELFDQLDEDRGIFKSVPTVSKHGSLAKNILNDLVKNGTCDINTAFALVTNAPQRWAKEQRERLGFTQTNAEAEVLANQIIIANDFLGNGNTGTIEKPRIKLEDWERSIKMTDQVFELTDRAVRWIEIINPIGAKTIRALHYFGRPDMSVYYINNYYAEAVESMSHVFEEEFSDKIWDLCGQVRADTMTDRELTRAYHNTVKALKTCSKVKKALQLVVPEKLTSYKQEHYRQSVALIAIVEKAIEAVKTYPVNGKELYEILIGIYNGISYKVMEKKMNMCRQTYYKRRTEAINLLSYLLWGYSTRQVVLVHLNIENDTWVIEDDEVNGTMFLTK